MQVQSIGLGVIPQPVDDDQSGPEVESVYIPGPRGYHGDSVIWSATGLLKADGAGNVSAAVEGTDYIAPSDLRTVVSTRTTAEWTVIAGEVTPHGKYLVSVVHSSACTCELPSPTSLGKSPGDKVNIMQGGVGTLTITDGVGGATHVGNAVFAAQYEIKTAIALDGTTWLLAGAQ